MGPNPTDRAKGGTKRSLLAEAAGIPLAIEIDAANRHDSRLVEATLMNPKRFNPPPAEAAPQHLCLDRGYDYGAVRAGGQVRLIRSRPLAVPGAGRGDQARSGPAR